MDGKPVQEKKLAKDYTMQIVWTGGETWAAHARTVFRFSLSIFSHTHLYRNHHVAASPEKAVFFTGGIMFLPVAHVRFFALASCGQSASVKPRNENSSMGRV